MAKQNILFLQGNSETERDRDIHWDTTSKDQTEYAPFPLR